MNNDERCVTKRIYFYEFFRCSKIDERPTQWFSDSSLNSTTELSFESVNMSPRQKSNQNFESNEIFCILLKLDTKNEKLYRYRAEVQDWIHHMIRIKFGKVNSVIQSISTKLQVRKDLAFFLVPGFVQVFAQVEFRFKTRLKSILVIGCQT